MRVAFGCKMQYENLLKHDNLWLEMRVFWDEKRVVLFMHFSKQQTNKRQQQAIENCAV